MNYELVEPEEARELFGDENEGLLFGINWMDEDNNIVDCSWFASDSERQEEIDRAYAEYNQFEAEQ